MLTDSLLQQADAEFKKVLDHLKTEFSHLQIGRANASIVESVTVDAYGSRQPLKNLANISVPDAKTIQIQPWDKGLLKAVETGIQLAQLNLNPTNDGIVIRINIPPLTEERRRDLTKVVSKLAEEAKISVRHHRQQFMDKIKAMEKNKEITEDEVKGSEKRLQDQVDNINKDIESLSKHKEKDIMTV